MSLTPSIADTALGLTSSELQILRQQQQQLAAQRHHQAETASRGRGRGSSRSSQPSSRAVSAASSQGGQGRVLLDPGSLQRLNAHFDHLMHGIEDRLESVGCPFEFLICITLNRITARTKHRRLSQRQPRPFQNERSENGRRNCEDQETHERGPGPR